MLNLFNGWKGLRGRTGLENKVNGWGSVIKKKNNSKSSWRHTLNTSVLKILEHLWSQDTGRGHLCFESFADILQKLMKLFFKKYQPVIKLYNKFGLVFFRCVENHSLDFGIATLWDYIQALRDSRYMEVVWILALS